MDANDFNSDAEREIALTSRRFSAILAAVYDAEGRELAEAVQRWIEANEHQ